MEYQAESLLHISESNKWYNSKLKLGLTILIWPLLIYGFYKTDLITRRNKIVFISCFIFLFIIGGIFPAKVSGRYNLVIPKKDEYLFGDVLRKQNAYFELNEDSSAFYHIETSMYGATNRLGKYSYNKDLKEVYIDWEDGNGPNVLNLKVEGGSYKFTVGETEYTQK